MGTPETEFSISITRDELAVTNSEVDELAAEVTLIKELIYSLQDTRGIIIEAISPFEGNADDKKIAFRVVNKSDHLPGEYPLNIVERALNFLIEDNLFEQRDKINTKLMNLQAGESIRINLID